MKYKHGNRTKEAYIERFAELTSPREYKKGLVAARWYSIRPEDGVVCTDLLLSRASLRKIPSSVSTYWRRNLPHSHAARASRPLTLYPKTEGKYLMETRSAVFSGPRRHDGADTCTTSLPDHLLWVSIEVGASTATLVRTMSPGSHPN